MVEKENQKISKESIVQKPLRLWPGIVLALLLAAVRFGLVIITPEAALNAVMGGLLGTLLIVVWWAFFSRASRSERFGGAVLIIVALIATYFVIHESMELMPFVTYIVPIESLLLVIWAVATSRFSRKFRRVSMVVTILLSCGIWLLIRTDGVTGEFQSQFKWRWEKTHEEKLLAQDVNQSISQHSATFKVDTAAYWPGFRGPDRDGIIRGVTIDTDWSVSPPVELWHRLIGPGWSSFAVRGNLLYTQEQRGVYEIVSCYKVSTGEPVWKHRDVVRFWESNSGVGPRGTPSLIDGRLYTLGATGILNVFDANDGTLIWSRNAATDTDTKIPSWGISSSPLVVGDLVITAAAGSLIAYDLATGEPRWFSKAGGECYSSPHLLSIDGVVQILLLNEAGAGSVAPADGKILWKYSRPGNPIVQPTLISDGDLLISTDDLTGLHRIKATLGSDGWTVSGLWTSDRIKPYFNDSVIHNGYVFGFDGPSLACIDINNGERKWKGGRYGRGQIVLLADQSLLLVLSERGKLALVKAVPGQYKELAQIQAIEGKTWNHPVIAGGVLLVRNSQEMAAFRLPLSGEE